ncbi:MAG: hypothetical protein ACQKBV_08030 [Puniceicoccales bacterium]
MNTEELIAKLKQYPLAVGCGVIVLIAAVLIFLRGGRLEVLETEYEEKLAKSELMSSNVNNAVDLEAHVTQINELVASVDSRLVDAEARPENYRYFLRLAENSQVNLTDQSTAKKAVAESSGNSVYTTVTFDLVVSGEYKNVLRFLYNIRTGRYISRIDGMTMRPSQTAGAGDNVVTVDLKVVNLGIPDPEPEKKKKKK